MLVVTGGAGFIGSNLVAALSERGMPAVVVDRLGTGDKWRNLAKHELADFWLPEQLWEKLSATRRRLTGVVHLGAISATTERDADAIIQNNFRLSLDLWQWCAQNELPFLYASSAATYGSGAQGFRDGDSIAELARLQPLNAYGWSKHLFDRRVARLLSERSPRPPQWVGLKFFNVYGPNEYHKGNMQSVVAKSYPLAAQGSSVSLFQSTDPTIADGGQTRDFIYVADCVQVLLWFLDTPQVNGIFNIGTGQARSFADLANAVFAALDQPPRIEYIPMPAELRGRYQNFTQADMTKLRAAGYTVPFYSLEDGIRDYVQRYLHTNDCYR